GGRLARRRGGLVGGGGSAGGGGGRGTERGAARRGGTAGLLALPPTGRDRARARRARRRPGGGRRGPRRPLRRTRARMTFLVLFWLNLALLCVFVVLALRPGLLGFAKGGKWYLTWFAVGLITLMDELTSIFYAPAEAHPFIGTQAIFFIVAPSLLIRVLSTRFVEIAQILECHNIRGGGVYSFSYFVLGPVASFVAVASIMVDYILTACISTVSAVINGTAFLPLGHMAEYGLILGVIWSIAGLNILGIRENARVTFGIFLVAAVVLMNLIALGLLHMSPESPGIMLESARNVTHSGG